MGKKDKKTLWKREGVLVEGSGEKGGQGEICSRNGLLLHWDQQGVRIEARLAGKRKRRTRDAGGWRKKGKKEETARNGGGGKEE